MALNNISGSSAPLATTLINTYRDHTDLFFHGSSLLSEEGTTQGDPLAMPMYAIATIPLIRSLPGDVQQTWYADDASTSGSLKHLRAWWDELLSLGPAYDYNANALKTWLITKQQYLQSAKEAFRGMLVNISADGRPLLGAALGTWEYTERYVNKKVMEWCSELENLASIADTQPHAAYAAITHGLASKWSYISRTTPDIGNLLNPIEDTLRTKLFPTMTRRPPPNDDECDLLALPVRLGGIGMSNPSKRASEEFAGSL